MSKILVAYTLLCMVAINIAKAEDIIELHLESPVTLLNSDGLYTLWKTNTLIHLNSTNGNFKPCSIDIDPVKDFTIMKIQAKQLSNGKFILWALRNFNYDKTQIVNLNYTALIVDPSSCSYKAVLIPEETTSTKTWPLFSSRVIDVRDGFDFFYPRHGKCSPCRFSLQGEPIPLKYQLEPEDEVFVPYGFNILPIDENDLSKGYIYTLNFKNDTSIIKYLNANFKITKQVLLQHPIHSISVNSNKQTIISICYASHNFVDHANHNFKVYCEQFDSDFNSKLTHRLPVPDDQFVFGLTGITHRVNPSGNIFIGLMQCSQKNTTIPASRQLRLFVIDKTGKILETRDYEKTNMKSISEWFELHSHLSLDMKFCVVSDVAADVSITDTHEIITCLDVSKYSD